MEGFRLTDLYGVHNLFNVLTLMFTNRTQPD